MILRRELAAALVFESREQTKRALMLFDAMQVLRRGSEPFKSETANLRVLPSRSPNPQPYPWVRKFDELRGCRSGQ